LDVLNRELMCGWIFYEKFGYGTVDFL